MGDWNAGQIMEEGKTYDLDGRLYNFSLRIVKLVRLFPKETAGWEMGRQLIRAGTSIVANFEEARGAFSRDDFIYKISVAFKEARETNLWLRLIGDSELIPQNKIETLIQESAEIRNILGKSLKTARKNRPK